MQVCRCSKSLKDLLGSQIKFGTTVLKHHCALSMGNCVKLTNQKPETRNQKPIRSPLLIAIIHKNYIYLNSNSQERSQHLILYREKNVLIVHIRSFLTLEFASLLLLYPLWIARTSRPCRRWLF